MSAQAAEKVKASVQKVKDKAQAIVDEIEVSPAALLASRLYSLIAVCNNKIYEYLLVIYSLFWVNTTNLRGINKLTLPMVNITTQGLMLVSYRPLQLRTHYRSMLEL